MSLSEKNIVFKHNGKSWWMNMKIREVGRDRSSRLNSQYIIWQNPVENDLSMSFYFQIFWESKKETSQCQLAINYHFFCILLQIITSIKHIAADKINSWMSNPNFRHTAIHLRWASQASHCAFVGLSVPLPAFSVHYPLSMVARWL